MESKYVKILIVLTVLVVVQVFLVGFPWPPGSNLYKMIHMQNKSKGVTFLFSSTPSPKSLNQSVSSNRIASVMTTLSSLLAIVSSPAVSSTPNPSISKLESSVVLESLHISQSTLTFASNDPSTCSYEIPANGGPIAVNKEQISMEQVEKLLSDTGISEGGHWRPSDCTALHRVAILIPFRDRESQLPIFLRHMHSFLQAQKLDYGIYVIEQTAKSQFNRAMLLNIGFVEANKQYDWLCYALHDVDLLPEDNRNLYTCPWENPRHSVAAHGGHGYGLVYQTYFGGVSQLTRTQIENINGFSNMFFGWGGEDDDIWNRIVSKGYRVVRYPVNIGRYTPLPHKGANASPDRFKMLETGKMRFSTDGINSLEYQLQTTTVNKLYTRFVVEIDQNSVLKGK